MTQFFYLYTDEEMNQFCANESIKLGRLTKGNQMRVHYARCGVALLNTYNLKHMPYATLTTGMTNAQKAIVMECNRRRMGAPSRVQSEFKRKGDANLAANILAIAKPSVSMIASYLSYERKKARGSVTLQDLEAYASQKQYGASTFALPLIFPL